MFSRMARRTDLASRYLPCCQRRNMAVYAVGENWTGAMGSGDLYQHILGHGDDDPRADPPYLLFPGSVQSIAAGWAHSVFLSSSQDLFMCGRPQDLINLFRLYRFPAAFRNRLAAWHARQLRSHKPTWISSILASAVGIDDEEWQVARQSDFFVALSQLETEEPFQQVAASAGLTAFLTESGKLCTMGVNARGQCGIGKSTRNVWSPTPVSVLRDKTDHDEYNAEKHVYEESPLRFSQVALGFQHGLALTREDCQYGGGRVYAWGKGERSQVSLDTDAAEAPTPIDRFVREGPNGRQQVIENTRIVQIDAGMNHNAALSTENQVFLWGKHTAPAQEDDTAPFGDSYTPFQLHVPSTEKVVAVACGSHHTSILLEDGSVYCQGLSVEREPVWDFRQILPPGMIQMPVRQFTAHFDRTTVVGRDGKQVLEFQLFTDEECHRHAVFTPQWADLLLDQKQRILSTHRGWLHTLIVTEDEEENEDN